MSNKNFDEVVCNGKKSRRLTGSKRIVLIGNPNVGKSLIFNRLTGSYVTVSNYPGTTVDVFHGKSKINNEEYEVVDTPGMYSLLPITEEERVARSILLEEKPYVVLNIVDAKNLDRMLHLTIQLIETGLPLILVINMVDEAERLGIEIKINEIEKEIGIPVIATAATTGRGIRRLKEKIASFQHNERKYQLDYGKEINGALNHLKDLGNLNLGLSGRSIGLLLLQEDTEIVRRLKAEGNSDWGIYKSIILKLKKQIKDSPHVSITNKRHKTVTGICSENFIPRLTGGRGFAFWFSNLIMNPLFGIPFLLVVLYFALYKFVGEFGAGTIVDFLENRIFEEHINPVVNSWVTDRKSVV